MQHNKKWIRDVRSLMYLQQVGTVPAVVLPFKPSHQQDLFVPAMLVTYKTIIPQTDPPCLQCEEIRFLKKRKAKERTLLLVQDHKSRSNPEFIFLPDLDFPLPLFASSYKPCALLMILSRHWPWAPHLGGWLLYTGLTYRWQGHV